MERIKIGKSKSNENGLTRVGYRSIVVSSKSVRQFGFWYLWMAGWMESDETSTFFLSASNKIPVCKIIIQWLHQFKTSFDITFDATLSISTMWQQISLPQGLFLVHEVTGESSWALLIESEVDGLLVDCVQEVYLPGCFTLSAEMPISYQCLFIRHKHK
jgi:hypothetical protein